MLNTVVALVLPQISPFELGIVCELFGVDRSATGGGKFDFTLITPTPGRVRSDLGFYLEISDGLGAMESADLVLLPAFPHDQEVPEFVLEALRSAHRRGAYLLSVCSGAFAFAAAGLLDGRRCTTHWMHAAELSARYPKAMVDPSVLYIEDDRIITSAGSAAGIDAGLYLIRCELGAGVAANIARRMVVPPHREGGQAQYIDLPIPVSDCDSLTEILAWMTANLEVEQTVDDLAARALMSPRTFARRFRAETGTTPAAWLTTQRLLRARELLEMSDRSVDSIAELAGFGTGAVLRHHFARAVGTTPQAYRRTFTGKSPAMRSVISS